MTRLIPITGTYCVGNGQACAYLRDGNIRELFAPYYTMPPVLSLFRADQQSGDQVSTYRHENSGIFTTKIRRAALGMTELTDFTVPNSPVFVRRVVTQQPVTFELNSGFVCRCNTFGCREGVDGVTFSDVIFYLREGTPVHAYCNVDKAIYCRLILEDGVELTASEEKQTVTFPAGESRMLFVCGDAGRSELDSFYDLMETGSRLVSIPTSELLDEAWADWQAFFARIKDFSDLLKHHPQSAELTDAIQSVAVSLRSQTSREGGTLAGEKYHLAYGRDMYGVIRGYLALGLYREARQAIEFFIREFRKRGRMPNAVGMGCYGSHCWECDDVEQTGYYLLELSDYYQATGDTELLISSADYIRFLLNAQEKQLADGMLPFCGDETYIAGGLLPRACIFHGSMEATALYITGTERILALCQAMEILPSNELSEHHAVLEQCKQTYNSRFVKEGRILTNNPTRLAHAVLPRYIHGVCNGCYGFDYLRLTKEGGYLCMHCYGHRKVESTDREYSVDCATLMCGFVHSQFPPEDLVLRLVQKITDQKLEHPSEQNAVGYENGLLLYVLASKGIRNSLTERLLANLLATRTSGGVWSEYYRNGVVSEDSCPYRPWESAINLCGILKLLEAEKSGGA